MAERIAVRPHRMVRGFESVRVVPRVFRTRRIVLVGAGFVVAIGGFVSFATLQHAVSPHGITGLDRLLLYLMMRHRTPGLIQLASVISTASEVKYLLLIAVVAACLFWQFGATVAQSIAPLTALCVSVVTIGVAKMVTDWIWPPLESAWTERVDLSIPSGHAGTSTALFLAIGMVLAASIFRRQGTRVVAIFVGGAVPILIGLSRLELRAHWPSEVITGWLVGATLAVAMTVAMTHFSRLESEQVHRFKGLRNHAITILCRTRRSTS
jgi:membrane-associated phospholipid phosphatase